MNEIDEARADVSAAGPARATAAGLAKSVSENKGQAGAATVRAAATSLDARVTSLAAALRRARIESAEQAGVVADLRGVEIARLEILREALEPILAQAPQDCDLFDVAISPGDRPRLFIDAIGFVEMGRDRRAYRFHQDTRHGRILIGETEKVEDMVEAVTAYMAHRLIEREKALAVDYASGGSARASAAKAIAQKPAGPEKKTGFWPGAYRAYLASVELAAALAFLGLLAAIGLYVYDTYVSR